MHRIHCALGCAIAIALTPALALAEGLTVGTNKKDIIYSAASATDSCWEPGAHTLKPSEECIKQARSHADKTGRARWTKVDDKTYKIVLDAKEYVVTRIYGTKIYEGVDLAAGITEAQANPTKVIVVGDMGGALAVLALDTLDAAIVEPGAPTNTLPPPPWGLAECLAQVVDDAKESPDQIVCVDLIGGVKVLKAPRNNIISPNEGLVVVVRHAPGESLIGTMGGKRGTTKPTSSKGNVETASPGLTRQTQPTSVSVLRFGPHLAGSTEIVLQTVDKPDADPRERLRLELEVDERYWAAIRTGIGTVVGDFRGYEAISFDGSQQMQINEKVVPVQFELVIGFALFLDTFDGEGRSYTDSGHNWRLGPYVGFGLVGQNVDSVDGFTSVHLGMDIEFTSDISLAVTAVGRRTKHLVDGYVSGSPVAAGSTAFLEDGIDFGGGLIITATPDFLKIK